MGGYFTYRAVYVKLDAQCDKLKTVVNDISTDHGKIFLRSEFETRNFVLEISEFPYNTL